MGIVFWYNLKKKLIQKKIHVMGALKKAYTISSRLVSCMTTALPVNRTRPSMTHFILSAVHPIRTDRSSTTKGLKVQRREEQPSFTTAVRYDGHGLEDRRRREVRPRLFWRPLPFDSPRGGMLSNYASRTSRAAPPPPLSFAPSNVLAKSACI